LGGRNALLVGNREIILAHYLHFALFATAPAKSCPLGRNM
jgi:hypothetical protein